MAGDGAPIRILVADEQSLFRDAVRTGYGPLTRLGRPWSKWVFQFGQDRDSEQ